MVSNEKEAISEGKNGQHTAVVETKLLTSDEDASEDIAVNETSAADDKSHLPIDRGWAWVVLAGTCNIA